MSKRIYPQLLDNFFCRNGFPLGLLLFEHGNTDFPFDLWITVLRSRQQSLYLYKEDKSVIRGSHYKKDVYKHIQARFVIFFYYYKNKHMTGFLVSLKISHPLKKVLLFPATGWRHKKGKNREHTSNLSPKITLVS